MPSTRTAAAAAAAASSNGTATATISNTSTQSVSTATTATNSTAITAAAATASSTASATVATSPSTEGGGGASLQNNSSTTPPKPKGKSRSSFVGYVTEQWDFAADDEIDEAELLEAITAEVEAFYKSLGSTERAKAAFDLVQKYGLEIWPALFRKFPQRAEELEGHRARARRVAAEASATEPDLFLIETTSSEVAAFYTALGEPGRAMNAAIMVQEMGIPEVWTFLKTMHPAQADAIEDAQRRARERAWWASDETGAVKKLAQEEETAMKKVTANLAAAAAVAKRPKLLQLGLSSRFSRDALARATAATQRKNTSASESPAAAQEFHELRLRGTWTEAVMTSYTDVTAAPQYKIVPARTCTLDITLEMGYASPVAALTLVPAHPRGVREGGQPTKFSSFTNYKSLLRGVRVEAGKTYTLIVCAYEKKIKAGEKELDWTVTAKAVEGGGKGSGGKNGAGSSTSASASSSSSSSSASAAASTPTGASSPPSPTLILLEPPTPLTMTLRDLMDSDANAARVQERQRRAKSLARMEAQAMASPPGSSKRESWADFLVAAAEVERAREAVRRAGGGARYRDGWSGTSNASGVGWAQGMKAEWVGIHSIAPHPVVIDNGFSLEDVMQGELGDCYFLAALADLAAPGEGESAGASLKPSVDDVLDSLIVTGEDNPEGVFCVRLWVGSKWVHLLMDDLLPCKAGVYVDITKPRQSILNSADSRPAPEQGRFHRLLSVHSSSLNEMWPCLLEKAWAKLHGSYASVEGHRSVATTFPLNNFIPNSLPGFTEAVPTTAPAKATAAAAAAETDLAALWTKLCYWHKMEWPMTAASRNKARGGGADHGIIREHAFSILRVFPTASGSGSSSSSGSSAAFPQLVQLRNPHGEGEWDGKYSDTDTASWTPALCSFTGYDPRAGGDDGIFWMSFSDFCDQFSSINVTPIVALARDGGRWHRKQLRGYFSMDLVGAAQASWSCLQVTQYLLHCPSKPGAKFYLHFEIEGRRYSAKDAMPTIVLGTYYLRGGDGFIPATRQDIYSTPGKTAPFSQAAPSVSFAGTKGEASTTGVAAPPGSTLVFIPELLATATTPKQGHLYYVITVMCEDPFTMRHGNANKPGTTTEEGVMDT